MSNANKHAADGGVDRFFDARTKKQTVRIKAGEYYACNEDEHISTVLGSCIAACIRDELSGFGGMNHFMLPAGPNEKSTIGEGALYGGFAMESLINELLKNGARRDRFEIKLFGGGNVIDLSSNVGSRNIEFVRHYLQAEGLAIVGEDIGGDVGRSLVYSPITGRAMVKLLPKVYTRTIEREEQMHAETVNKQLNAGSIDLF